MTGNDIQSIDVCRIDSVADVRLVDDAFINGTLHFRNINAKTAGGIGLRVCVYYQNGLLQRSQ